MHVCTYCKDSVMELIEEAVASYNRSSHRKFNITRTDWTTFDAYCQKCRKAIPTEERPIYMFISYKGHHHPEGLRCLKCTARYLGMDVPIKAFADVWFNNGRE